MAFSDADSVRRLVVSGTASGTGTGSETTFANFADILVRGTFTGNIIVEAQDDSDSNNWVGVCQLTAEGADVLSFAKERPLRVRWVLSTGTATFSLETATTFREER